MMSFTPYGETVWTFAHYHSDCWATVAAAFGAEMGLGGSRDVVAECQALIEGWGVTAIGVARPR
jgi:hypothetical protein